MTPDKDVIAYCRIGERSSHTWFVLHELLGYKRVRNYDGSWTEYGSLIGVPIEKPVAGRRRLTPIAAGPASGPPVAGEPARAAATADPAVSSGGDPDAPTERRSALRRLPDRVAAARADRRRRALPRPARAWPCSRAPGPGRNARWTYLTADPVAVLEAPAAGPDPFAVARRLVAPARPDGRRPGRRARGSSAASSASSATTSGTRSSGCRRSPPTTRACRSSASRSTTGSSPGTGGPATPGSAAGRSTATAAAWPRRLDDVHARLTRPGAAGAAAGDRTSRDRRPADARRSAPGLVARRLRGRRRGRPRAHRARRHLPGQPDPPARDAVRWRSVGRCYRRLRTGDPSLFSAYLDLGPEPADRPAAGAALGLARAVPLGRRRGPRQHATRSRARGRAAATRDEDRALARELLGSAKDRAENVMIVDVLRNDLGRVCRPGSVRVPAAVPPRADRRGPAPRLDRDRPARRRAATPSTCWPPSFPGGSITGAPEDPGDGDPRGASSRSGAARTPARSAGSGPDGAMQTSILIRTFVADGRRLTLHVGGGITWRSDPAAEWDETVAKARGPLGAIGGVEVA